MGIMLHHTLLNLRTIIYYYIFCFKFLFMFSLFVFMFCPLTEVSLRQGFCCSGVSVCFRVRICDVTRDDGRCVISCLPGGFYQSACAKVSRVRRQPIAVRMQFNRQNSSDKRRKSFINSRHFARLRSR